MRETFKVIPNVPYEFILILKSMQERNALGIEELLKPGTRSSEDEQKLNEEMAGNELPPLVYDPAEARNGRNGRNDGAADGQNDGAMQMYNENENELEDENVDESEEEDEDDEELETEELKVLVVETVPIDIS